ncbi:hypothetical protein ACVBEF_02015 [Glaciimonas sp. GG7]
MRLSSTVFMAGLLTMVHAGYTAPVAGGAAQQAVAAGMNMPPVVAQVVDDLFAKPLVLRGTLGDATIEMRLQLKPDPTEGLQGTYSAIGQSAKILLAGEYDGSDVIMEESVNGKDVSGEWSGKFDGTTFSGTWSTTDDAIAKPFVLKVQIAK